MKKELDLSTKILTDLKIKLSDAFDQNFTRKAFFSKPWTDRKRKGSGSLLNVRGGGGLRGSLNSVIEGSNIRWSSSLPYADIHNQGGTITVTTKMKRFFWAKYYEAAGQVKYKKSGAKSQSKRNERMSEDAKMYHAMALMKVGSKITIPQRQFIGPAPEVDAVVAEVIEKHAAEVEAYLREHLSPTLS